MRILVISDSHGRNDDIEGVLKQVGDIDMMIHCGDVERGDSYIREIADCPVVMVAGNNDYYLDLPSEEEVRIGDYSISDSWTWLLCKLRCGLFKRTCFGIWI